MYLILRLYKKLGLSLRYQRRGVNYYFEELTGFISPRISYLHDLKTSDYII